jgi:hypothetical protein
VVFLHALEICSNAVIVKYNANNFMLLVACVAAQSVREGTGWGWGGEGSRVAMCFVLVVSVDPVTVVAQ